MESSCTYISETSFFTHIILMRSTFVKNYRSNSFVFIARNVILKIVHQNSVIMSFADGHLSCLQFCTLRNADVSIQCVYRCFSRRGIVGS